MKPRRSSISTALLGFTILLLGGCIALIGVSTYTNPPRPLLDYVYTIGIGVLVMISGGLLIYGGLRPARDEEKKDPDKS